LRDEYLYSMQACIYIIYMYIYCMYMYCICFLIVWKVLKLPLQQ
jgi:hypothetical protein